MHFHIISMKKRTPDIWATIGIQWILQSLFCGPHSNNRTTMDRMKLQNVQHHEIAEQHVQKL